MSAATRLHQLRLFMLGLAALLFAGSIVELIAVKHYGELMQLVPFALCALGLIAVALMWRPRASRSVMVVRVAMLVIAAGSLLGVYEHLEGNYSFAHDIHPKASTSELIKATFHGADPLLAPGMLAVGAVLTIAATYASATVAEPALAATATDAQPLNLQSRPSLQ